MVERCHSLLYNEISLIASVRTSTAKVKTKKTVLAKWGFLVAAYV